MRNKSLNITKRMLIFVLFTVQAFGQKAAPFLAPDKSFLLSTDLHIHTVFSDGSVWPDIRIEEARREGIDLIAITDHLEYQPHQTDIPHPDRNRSFELAQNSRIKGERLQVVNGAEITREMPPGHINAVFIENANALLKKDSLSGILAANKQGAFVFWNHPTWDAQRPDGIARLDPFHSYLIKKNLLHGIEVVNEVTFSEEALSLALENDLTILGTSDIHGLTDWLFNIPQGGHRPLTFVLAEDRSEQAIKKALFEGKTIVWFNDYIIGKQKHVHAVLKANLKAKAKGYGKETTLFTAELSNFSAMPLKLEYQGKYSFYNHQKFIEIPANSSREIRVKTRDKKAKIALSFKVLNALIGPKENAVLTFDLATK